MRMTERGIVMNRKIYLLTMLFCSVLLLWGCANEAQEEELEKIEVTLLSPKAPVLIPSQLLSTYEHELLNVEVQTWDTVEQLMAAIQGDESSFIAAPLNIGVNAYNQGIPLQLLHVNTWGSMYLVSTQANDTFDAIQGNKIYVPGQGGPPDILTKYILEEKGLLNHVELVYAAVPEVLQLLASGKAQYAVLPEPVVSGLRMQVEQITDVIDFDQYWLEAFGEHLPQTGIFVREPWAKEHPQYIEAFQQLFSQAVQQVETDLVDVIPLAAEAFGLPEMVIQNALPRLQFGVEGASEAKDGIERYLKVLYDVNPAVIGGKKPDEAFYYASDK